MANDDTVPDPDDTAPDFEGVGPGLLGPLLGGLEVYSAPGVWVEEGALPPVPDAAQEAGEQGADDDSTSWEKIAKVRSAILAFLRSGPERNGLTQEQTRPLHRAVRLFDQVLADYEGAVGMAEKAALSEAGNITLH